MTSQDILAYLRQRYAEDEVSIQDEKILAVTGRRSEVVISVMTLCLTESPTDLDAICTVLDRSYGTFILASLVSEIKQFEELRFRNEVRNGLRDWNYETESINDWEVLRLWLEEYEVRWFSPS